MVLFTGKGGVGKTSVAAATAVRAARRGHRVLVTSTDPAHSLADAFGRPLGDAPSEVAVPGAADGALVAQQLDAQARLERRWHDVRAYLVGLLVAGGADDVQAEELVVLPGLDELFSLVDLRAQVERDAYDLVVVDCAPTAETLRLLALPEALRWYVERLLGPGRRWTRAVRPLAAAAAGVPLPPESVFSEVGRLHEDLAAVHALLQDPERTSVRLVTAAERVVVAETARTATSLGLFGYAVDAVIVNRLLPDAIHDPHLLRWRERQREHLATIREDAGRTPVLTAPLFPDELDGVAGLGALGDEVYGDADETAILAASRPLEIRPGSDGPVLRLAVQGVRSDEVVLHRRGDDLHLKVAGVARNLALPAALRRLEVRGAKVVDGAVEVRFGPVAPTGPDTSPTGPSTPPRAVGSA